MYTPSLGLSVQAGPVDLTTDVIVMIAGQLDRGGRMRVGVHGGCLSGWASLERPAQWRGRAGMLQIWRASALADLGFEARGCQSREMINGVTSRVRRMRA